MNGSCASLGLFIRSTWMALCLPCLCFGMECGKNGNKLNKLFKSPLTFWTTACSRFQSHSVGNTDTTHGNAVIAMADFMDNMTRRAVPINQQIDQLMQQQINENREKMKSIIKTVIFCGQIYRSEEGEITTQTMPVCRESSKRYFNFESTVVIRSLFLFSRYVF